MPRKISDAKLDLMGSAYQAEYDRWCERAGEPNKWVLIRNTSPNNTIIHEKYQEVIKLTKREARTRDEAQAWLRTYANRAAMRAALGKL